MRLLLRKLFSALVATVICSCLTPAPEFAVANETPSNAGPALRELGEQVDVLQLVADLKLKEKQVSYLLTKVESLEQKHEELRKREEAILESIREPLEKKREALATGKEVPDSVEAVTSTKLKELQEIRKQAWQEFESAVSSCFRILDKGQVRAISRTPEALKRAGMMVQQIRSASEQDWPKVLSELTAQLLEVKKLDKQGEWKAEENRLLSSVAEEEREAALAGLEEQKKTDIAQARVEITEMLTAIRSADPIMLPVARNNLASAMRTQAEVQAQIFAMMGRILGSPAAETALKMRLASMKPSTEEPPAPGE